MSPELKSALSILQRNVPEPEPPPEVHVQVGVVSKVSASPLTFGDGGMVPVPMIVYVYGFSSPSLFAIEKRH